MHGQPTRGPLWSETRRTRSVRRPSETSPPFVPQRGTLRSRWLHRQPQLLCLQPSESACCTSQGPSSSCCGPGCRRPSSCGPMLLSGASLLKRHNEPGRRTLRKGKLEISAAPEHPKRDTKALAQELEPFSFNIKALGRRLFWRASTSHTDTDNGCGLRVEVCRDRLGNHFAVRVHAFVPRRVLNVVPIGWSRSIEKKYCQVKFHN
jgi:hypothetical protein